MKIGFHASHEQFTPSLLLELAKAAQSAGFKGALSSDHFHPWNDRQGHSGFNWSWLGAALQATELPFGTVCTPGQRYHPAIIAQAVATLAEMFPGRFWIAVGSGQLLNEGITGDPWPDKPERNERLLESVGVIRALWAGETVTHYGLVTVEGAKLYSRPDIQPMIFGAAITPQTARWVGEWADGLITILKPVEELREVVKAFRSGGGEGKPMYLKMQVSYAATDEEALHGAWDQWRSTILGSSVLSDLRYPAQLDAAAKFIRPEDMHGAVHISSDAQKHIQWLRQGFELGFEQIFLHNVNPGQKRFIEDFGRQVLPAFQ